MEEICTDIRNKYGYEGEVMKTLLHEIFIYVIAFYYKNKDFDALSYTLSKTYFVGKYIARLKVLIFFMIIMNG